MEKISSNEMANVQVSSSANGVTGESGEQPAVIQIESSSSSLNLSCTAAVSKVNKDDSERKASVFVVTEEGEVIISHSGLGIENHLEECVDNESTIESSASSNEDTISDFSISSSANNSVQTGGQMINDSDPTPSSSTQGAMGQDHTEIASSRIVDSEQDEPELSWFEQMELEEEAKQTENSDNSDASNAVQQKINFNHLLVSDGWNREKTATRRIIKPKLCKAAILAKYSQPWSNPLNTDKVTAHLTGREEGNLELSPQMIGPPQENLTGCPNDENHNDLQSQGACALPTDRNDSTDWFDMDQLNRFLVELSSHNKPPNPAASVQNKVNFDHQLVSNEWNEHECNQADENIKRQKLSERVQIPRFAVSLEQPPEDPSLLTIYRQRLFLHRSQIIDHELVEVLGKILLSGDHELANCVDNHVRDRVRSMERDIEFDDLSSRTFNGIMSYLRRYDNWHH